MTRGRHPHSYARAGGRAVAAAMLKAQRAPHMTPTEQAVFDAFVTDWAPEKVERNREWLEPLAKELAALEQRDTETRKEGWAT